MKKKKLIKAAKRLRKYCKKPSVIIACSVCMMLIIVLWELGRAECKKHNLVVDFLNHGKFKRLTCPDKVGDTNGILD